ncbi:LuxR family transcriptional regulator [Jannaschia formosa]|uniref:LuxR family transcriptional regulator n=1 Tax=Jannaschia formosa TaxID=2259592 RepID=UPI000E1C1279|nr:LuxR family transcriptional regulator [Jannaschia formosa]TFL16745.1 LuxR family transcriptional regulator [Jannaschia formosa]
MNGTLDDLEGYLLSVTRTTDLETLWARHVQVMNGWGFDLLLYAATEFGTTCGPGDVRDALILTTYPQSFIRPYLDDGLCQNAPLIRWAMQNVGVRSFREIEEDYRAGRLSPEEMRVWEFTGRHGVSAGYGLSFPRTMTRSGHGIGLASSTMTQDEVDALWEREGQRIELINQVTHFVIRTLPYDAHGRKLTGRQREVLALIADGKSVQDVALMLGRNVATIEKHLRLAREALDVDTTAQAVLKASVLNQFHSTRMAFPVQT